MSQNFRNNCGKILFLQYTSGSTSDPKGVIVSHGNVIQNAHSTLDHSPIGVSWLPHYHDMGLIGYYLFPLITGGTAFFLSATDFLRRPVAWFEAMSRFKATYASSPNFGFEYCLSENKVRSKEIADLDLSSLRVLMNGSEPANAETCSKFVERFFCGGLRPSSFVVSYGLAENTLAATHFGRRQITVNRYALKAGKASVQSEADDRPESQKIMSCGQPLAGVSVKIVDHERRVEVDDGIVGEIWLAGDQVCMGYWNDADRTEEIFRNTLVDPPEDLNLYLRTGDLGFVCDGELYVCGRLKDVIIVRGTNYYPQDVEAVIKTALSGYRHAAVAAFAGNDESLIVAIEWPKKSVPAEPSIISRAILRSVGIIPSQMLYLPTRSILKTTSGKIRRLATRKKWLDRKLSPFATYCIPASESRGFELTDISQRYCKFLKDYNLIGNETLTLAEIGLDSLTMVSMLLDIEAALEKKGLVFELDGHVLQRLTVTEFSVLLRNTETDRIAPAQTIREIIEDIRKKQDHQEMVQMHNDVYLEGLCTSPQAEASSTMNVLFTGSTGFFGPFLLKRFLTETDHNYYVLVRARTTDEGMKRIQTAIRSKRLWTPFIEQQLQRRVTVICGDISQSELGLPRDQWEFLASELHAIVHNAAMVNYVSTYRVLRSVNVDGTRELIRLAFAVKKKVFSYVSSTVIFGWTVRERLFEADNNSAMDQLTFGYAQSKWVAEQLVLLAQQHGLVTKIVRPSFITASSDGVGSKDDIVIRLLAFMINQGIAVRATNQLSFVPADSAASGIASVLMRPQTTHGTFHVTVGSYYNMMDVTEVLSREYELSFRYLAIPEFIVEMKKRCKWNDPVFPLLEFFRRSGEHISAIQNKRYDSTNYRLELESNGNDYEPALKVVVGYLVSYMVEQRLIRVPVRKTQ